MIIAVADKDERKQLRTWVVRERATLLKASIFSQIFWLMVAAALAPRFLWSQDGRGEQVIAVCMVAAIIAYDIYIYARAKPVAVIDGFFGKLDWCGKLVTTVLSAPLLFFVFGLALVVH